MFPTILEISDDKINTLYMMGMNSETRKELHLARANQQQFNPGQMANLWAAVILWAKVIIIFLRKKAIIIMLWITNMGSGHKREQIAASSVGPTECGSNYYHYRAFTKWIPQNKKENLRKEKKNIVKSTYNSKMSKAAPLQNNSLIGINVSASIWSFVLLFLGTLFGFCFTLKLLADVLTLSNKWINSKAEIKKKNCGGKNKMPNDQTQVDE